MPVRIIHVGLGGWGQDWEQHPIPQVKTVQVVAFVDADPTILAAARKTLNLPPERCFPALAAALTAIEADAVLITTPIAAHIPVAREALAAGKHVLVEKPFAPTVAEARQAVDDAAARGRILMVSQNYRFFPAPRAVAAQIASGELGPVGALYADFRRPVTTATASPRHAALANPLLADMAIHHFDLMRLILRQEPLLVSCQTWNPPWSPFANPAAGTATISFDGGAVVSWRGSWASPGAPTIWGGEWRAECEGGEMLWTSRDENGTPAHDRLEIRPVNGKARIAPLPPAEPYGRAGVLTAFAHAVESGTPPETSGRDNLGSLAIVAAAIESAATGHAVSLNADAR